MLPVSRQTVGAVLEKMDISDIGRATIRQCVNVAKALEQASGEKFVHLEFGIPGLEACRLGVEAQKQALDDGRASVYPPASGIPALKENGSRFIKAFVDVDVPAECIVPTVGSMQGCYNLLLECSQMCPDKDTVVYISPGFSSHYVQTKVLGLRTRTFDIYDNRGEALRPCLENLFRDGRVCAVVYSNPNNPSWVCLTEQELRIIGELCTKYDVIALEDMAYMCMDFRQDRSVPYKPPFQPTVAHYTDNFVMMISASKIFSYAGERIAMAAISPELYHRRYPALGNRYGMDGFGENFAMTYIYVNVSGCSHSSQSAFAAMLGAAADGICDFVDNLRDYARRSGRVREIFRRYGFFLVYDKDLDEDVSNGFFFTVGYPDMSGKELQLNLLQCGICAISLVSSRSTREGIRVCVSLMKKEQDYVELDNRLRLFKENLAAR